MSQEQVLEDQKQQIEDLKAQIAKIDAMSRESVYADPVSQVQQQVYSQLIAIREGFAQALAGAMVDTPSSAAGASAAQPSKSAAAAGDSEEVLNLRAENKKLKYRVAHLLRAIDEIEAKQAAK